MPQNDQALLERLSRAGLDFVVIGGVCAVFHGVPAATFDLDVCCPLGEENLRRIRDALSSLHPRHRLTANKLPFEVSTSSFSMLKNLYLQTDLGALDCLSQVLGVGDFNEVKKRSVVATFSYGQFRFLDLDALIDAKRAVARERDLSTMHSLLAIKERREKQSNSAQSSLRQSSEPGNSLISPDLEPLDRVTAAPDIERLNTAVDWLSSLACHVNHFRQEQRGPCEWLRP